jgi:exonuclease SbcC
MLQAAAAVRKQREARRIAIGAERQEVTGRRETASREATKMAENLEKLESVRALVAQQAEFEERERTAQAAADMANARLQQTHLSREQAGAGNCPFLAEPCLNIQRRGENNLRAYFDKRIADEERALAPIRAKLAEASKVAEDVRRKALGFARLDEFRERLQRTQAALAECAATDARLNAEETEIAADLKRAGDHAGLEQAQFTLQASEDADRKLAALALLQRDLAEKRARREQLVTEREQLERTVAKLADAPAALQAVEHDLEELNDPRGRSIGLVERAAERPKLEEALAALERTLRELATERAGVAESLEPFANLDAELTALEEELRQTRDDHLRFVQHERSAAQAPALAQERAAAAAAHATAENVSTAAQQSLEAARAGFDANEDARVNKLTQEVSAARGANRQELHSLRADIVALEEELQRGKAQVTALEAARVEADELAATEVTLQQFRGLIKDAGPQVTRALLSQISQQANTIFGDIIGDRASMLSWENDYEIVLRRDGKTRSFAQLSGGEQMSAALAVRLALLRRLTRLDMAFFDEPTQNMDGERRSALAEQLRRVRGFEQLIVISHDDTFEQGLDSVIHLEKRDGATRVAEGEEVFAANTDAPLEEDLSALAFG